MPSIWERIGEGIGYGLAAVVLGPQVAIERRQRRTMRSAFREWSASLGATSLVPPRSGERRCAVMLPTSADAIAAEVTLDPYGRTAALAATPPQLPALVDVIVSVIAGARPTLMQVTTGRSVMGKPLVASHDPLYAFSETLDEATCQALIDAMASGPFGHGFHATRIDIRHDGIDVALPAPTSVAEWQALTAGIVALSRWLAEKWPVSYRT